MAMSSAIDRVASVSMATLNFRPSSAGPWIAGSAALAWLATALLTALWSDKPGTDWAYTSNLAAAFGALAAALALATFASILSVAPRRVQRLAPWALALALFLGAWEAA